MNWKEFSLFIKKEWKYLLLMISFLFSWFGLVLRYGFFEGTILCGCLAFLIFSTAILSMLLLKGIEKDK